MKKIRIRLNCPPEGLHPHMMDSFLRGVFNDLVVFAYKIGNRIVLTKNDLVEAFKNKKHGKDLAEHFDSETWELAEVRRSDCSFV